MIGNAVVSFLANHQELIKGMVVGYIVSHPALLMRLIWQGAMKVPGVKQVLLSNPEGTKKFAQAMLDEFDKDVDAEVAAASAAVAAPVPGDASKAS
jgi:hypothetical protein